MSSGTFSQIYIQVIFAVKGRQTLISEKWEDELYKYITGIIQHKNQLLIAINVSTFLWQSNHHVDYRI